ncbi:MAG: hypothetical protein ACRDZ4_16405 [Egibacteraceae bacterium]
MRLLLAWRLVEHDEEVDVALPSLLAAGERTEQNDPQGMVGFDDLIDDVGKPLPECPASPAPISETVR